VNSPPLRIATRASQLALWQANDVAGRLRAVAGSREVVLVEVSTSGDRDRTQPLAAMGNTGVFTREVQRAVLDGRADLAVHSLKDLPTEPADGLLLAAVPERASSFDALVLPASRASGGEADPLGLLPPGARVGTGSPRRSAQLLHWRADVAILEIRGNVETRLRKLDGGEFDAIILAEAGLRRLDLGDRISGRLCPPLLYPAVGQGALGIECRRPGWPGGGAPIQSRRDDGETQRLLGAINDSPTLSAVSAERELLSTLGAGCHAPVGVETSVEGERLSLTAVVLSLDGSVRLFAELCGSLSEPTELGRRVAEDLLRQGADELVRREP
jgi:hydroxymethylbilane synthase